MYFTVLCVCVILHIFANFPLWTVHLYAATFKQHHWWYTCTQSSTMEQMPLFKKKKEKKEKNPSI
jgi:hypothetical protein